MNPISLAVTPAFLQPDKQTLARASHRDPEAFAQLYRAYLKPIYAYLLAQVGNGEDAQDLTSQTFLAALQGIDRYRGESKFSSWLFGIARNKCADHFRQRRAAGPGLDIDVADSQAAADPPLDELAQQNSRYEALARHSRALPADQAEALRLRIFAGLSAAEAGQVMGKSEAAVKMLVHRAVCELRTRVGNWEEAAE